MDSSFASQDNLGSMVLLTNKTTQISNKLLTLASPRPRRTWICRYIKVTMPPIGIIWYLPVCWLFHICLIMTCIKEMDVTQSSYVNSVVQVLLALSVAVILLFTGASIVKLGKPITDPYSGWTYQKYPSMKHIIQALRGQKYQLQALAAFILVNSYLLLKLNQLALLYQDKTLGNDTIQLADTRIETNSSESEIVVLLLPSIKSLPFMAFCVNFAVPMVFYTFKESEPVWQKQHFWGFYYSVFLLLSTLKYLSSAITFYAVSLKADESPEILISQGVTTWLPPLYAVSALSLFLHSFFLKIYMEMRFKTPVSGSSASNLTLRRKVPIYPSLLGVIVTTMLVIGSEVPFFLHLVHFVLLFRRGILVVYLLAFNSGFCLLSFCGCLILGLRRRRQAKKCRGKQRQIDSGVCLADSFLYQSGPDTTSKGPEKR
ncbi:uncharacterized protein [Dendropsophus ebraccatus]|uniref:uncharacterized protein n=1 Tax=Dendropsophus ebraccatus TaxID=150705 RepID=UPI0038316046